jgi:hypothetical protein
MRARLLRTLALVGLWLASCTTPPTGTPAPAGVHDLEGRRFELQAASEARATVLVFTDTQCPIANAYAPEIRRLAEEFVPRGVRFFLVYADPERSADDVRAHRAAFAYPMPALLDPDHELVRRAGATRTPEASVFLPDGSLVYRGRIDDRYVDFGKQRAAPTKHDLGTALEAVLSGARPAHPWPPAVGCAIP